uniref:U-SLPTX11 n=1 Tax=Hemiscolopendra marginata TaxID=943146 RepID=A0A646QF65_9MYRI
MFVSACIQLCTLTLVLIGSTHSFFVRNNVDGSNIDRPQQIANRVASDPICKANSACAQVQTTSKGTSVVNFCTCGGGQSCPQTWNPSDGKTYSQGNDQYKFCSSAPSGMSVCDSTQTAYTNKYEHSGDTVVEVSNFFHCSCPSTHRYVHDDSEINGDIIISKYKCTTLHTCESNEICGKLADGQTLLMDRKCKCPSGVTCPSNPDLKSGETTVGSGTVYDIRCQ